MARRLVVAAVSVLLLGGLPAAALAGDESGGGGGSSGSAAGSAGAGWTRPVTLVTGDRVLVTDDGSGTLSTSVSAAPRPDGSRPVFHTFGDGDHLYVLPSDVAGLVPDRLDRALFDVALQARAGRAADAAPVIVQQDPAFRGPQPDWAAIGVEPGPALPSIGALAAHVPAPAAQAPSAVWALLESGTAQKVWLDQPVQAFDEGSAVQVGAPQAWEAGYTGEGVRVGVVDTGVDVTHPDLDEAVVAQEDFTGGGDPADRNGHGTHVASILAGSGDASGGAHRGVAPEADLVVAKGLDDTGWGDTSWMIAGMQWAADQGAEVVNVSAGIPFVYTDGSDPLSRAAQALTDQGVLVVAAAGNEGRQEGAVAVPAAADSALAVGAVDPDDAAAGFSSSGPRGGDHALKPDIAAPGVGIVGARATGTEAGFPVDDLHVAIDGTSMSAPHVTAAAALMLQARPDLTAGQLKALLMGSAQSAGNSTWREGAGRLWIPGALAQTVTSDPPSVSLGHFPFPQEDAEPVTRTVTYTSTAPDAVALDLAVELTDRDGAPVTGAATLSAPSVTIPAGGTASVDLTVDPGLTGTGLISGAITATGTDGAEVRTPIGLSNEIEMYDVTFRVVDRDGSPGQFTEDFLFLDSLEQDRWEQVMLQDGVATTRVEAGSYLVLGSTVVKDEAGADLSATLVQRGIDVSADMTVTVDASQALPTAVSTHRESEVRMVNGLLRWDGPDDLAYRYAYGGEDLDLYTLPGAAPASGRTDITISYEADQPILKARADGTPVNLRYGETGPRVDGHVKAPLAGWTSGSVPPGAYVLADPPEDGALTPLVDKAMAAGAAGVVFAGSTAGAVPGWFDTVPAVPVLAADAATAADLRARLAAGEVTLQLSGRAAPSYAYSLLKTVEGGIPDEPIVVRGDRRTTATVHRYVQGTAPQVVLGSTGSRPEEGGTLQERVVPAPWSLTMYVTALPDVEWTFGAVPTTQWGVGSFDSVPRTLDPGSVHHDVALAPVFHGGFTTRDADLPGAQSVIWRGDDLSADLPAYVDDAGHAVNWPGFDEQVAFRLRAWRGDELLADSDQYPSVFAPDQPAEAAEYRLRFEVDRATEWWPLSTHVETEWTFPSQPAPGEEVVVVPALQLDYGLEPDAGSRTERLTLTARHQSLSHGAPLAGMRLWVSADDGATWEPVRVRSGSDGQYRAMVTVPRGTAYVSLKAEAWDTAGSRVSETVIRAYAVR